MVARFAAFVIWAALAASAVFWGTRLTARPTPVPEHAAVVTPGGALNGDLTRLLGADPPPQAAAVAAAAAPPAEARYRLVGVVAPRSGAANGPALAMIAFDDKPPKPYRIGAAVEGELVLQSVHARGAALGPRGAPAQVTLALPAMPAAATAGLPPGAAPPVRGGPVTLPLRPQMQSLPRTPSETPLAEQVPADAPRGDGAAEAPERPSPPQLPNPAGRTRPPV
jgi:general secretion pathway protein C